MKKLMIASIALAVGFGAAGNATAADERTWRWSPLGVGIAAPLQLPFMSSDIYGLRLDGFLGINNDVYGVDCGVVGLEYGSFVGVQADAFTWTYGNVYGIQVGSLANVVEGSETAIESGFVNVIWGDMIGLQLGAVNYDTSFIGLQSALLNWVNTDAYGLQVAVANANQDAFYGAAIAPVNYAVSVHGFQCGAVNVANDMTGFQLGVFNACEKIHGVQIGLINLIATSKLPIMIIANASF